MMQIKQKMQSQESKMRKKKIEEILPDLAQMIKMAISQLLVNLDQNPLGVKSYLVIGIHPCYCHPIPRFDQFSLFLEWLTDRHLRIYFLMWLKCDVFHAMHVALLGYDNLFAHCTVVFETRPWSCEVWIDALRGKGEWIGVLRSFCKFILSLNNFGLILLDQFDSWYENWDTNICFSVTQNNFF